MWRIRAAIGVLALALAGPVPAAFEIDGQGAQSAALGGAFIAATDVAEAVWFNPAGNARLQRRQIATSHALLYAGLPDSPGLNALAAAVPLAGGGLHLGFSALAGEDWNEEVLAVGYGRALHPRLALGVGARSRGWRTPDLSRRALSLDLGGVYEVGWVHPRAYVQVAVAVRNINRANIAAGGQSAGRTPRVWGVGVGAGGGGQRVLLDIERRHGRTEVRAGYEARSASLLGARLRVGGRFAVARPRGREVDVGLGHKWKQWRMDYAYTYPLRLNGLGGIHRISLGYSRR